ncbi:MAG: DNA polymerase Y family protein [Sulfuricella sp.]|nr:DNA polymerase Y family protein [Sulfuricella sp.]
MLWLSLYFPHLPLEIFPQGAVLEPLAVADGRLVLNCNREAEAAGVRPGMAVSAAAALAPQLRFRRRDEAAEAAALSRLAAWAGQYTPAVSLVAPHGLLLEVGGCLRLFGGLEALAGRVREDVAGLGYRAFLAVAPTPLGAWLLAHAGLEERIGAMDGLARRLQDLPLALLGLPPATVEALHGIGAVSLGDCLRLPRAGLNRRFGPALLDRLDRALGRRPDPRVPFVPPASFEARLELPAEVWETEALLFATRRLLLELEGYLIGRGGGVQRLSLTLIHHKRPATAVMLGLAAPGRDARHWLALLRERLGQLALPAAVEAVALAADDIRPLGGRNFSLFQDAQQESEERAALVERLQARLGAAAVRGLCAVDEHRPELAWRHGEPGEKAPVPVCGQRPLWLLGAPEPLGAPEGLVLRAGPERIESGWWDGRDMARDYFVAEDSHGARLWVFRELRGERRWFLHGYF